VVFFINDALQPPVFPLARPGQSDGGAVQDRVPSVMGWLQQSHGHFGRMDFGEMVYEAVPGLGFGFGMYFLFLALGCWFVKVTAGQGIRAVALPLAWWVAPWLTWIAYAVLLTKLGSRTRLALPRRFIRCCSFRCCAGHASPRWRHARCPASWQVWRPASVLPVNFSDARPSADSDPDAGGSFGQARAKKHRGQIPVWTGLRDDLAPLRAALPPGVTRLRLRASFLDSPYGLWKPFGSRVVVELGLPLGSHRNRPPIWNMRLSPDAVCRIVTRWD